MASIALARTSACGATGSGVTSSTTDTGAVTTEIDFFGTNCAVPPASAIYPTSRHLSVKVFIDISLNASGRKPRSVEGDNWTR